MTEDMSEKPRVCAGAIILNKEGEMLLARSHKFSHQWIVPGGGVEWGETMEDCIRREIQEETGLSLDRISFFDTDEEIFPKEFFKKQHFIFLDFIAWTSGKKVVLNEEAEEFVWLSPQKALEIDLNPSTRRFIRRFLARPIESGGQSDQAR